MVTEQGRQPTDVAKELGICIDTLRNWLKASGIQLGQVRRVNREQQRIRELEAENRNLRKQLVEKEEVVDVLKKSVGILSKPYLLKPEFGCSRKHVHRQMQLAGVSSVRRLAYKRTTNSNHGHPIAQNLLERNFKFARPDQAWVGNITYIPTGEG